MAQHMAASIAAPGNTVPITFLGGQSTKPSQGTARLDTLVAKPPALAIAAPPPQQGSEARLEALVASTSALSNPADAAGLLGPRANVATGPMPAIEDGPSPSVAAIADTADTSASEPATKKPLNVYEKIMAARLKLKTHRAKALWGGDM